MLYFLSMATAKKNGVVEKTSANKKKGRPTKFTKELADLILKRIAEGESVRFIARDIDMPNASTIHAWVLDNEDFSKHYARAKDIGMEVEADEIADIASKALKVVKGTDKSDNARVQAIKLEVDTRKWLLSKKAPKKYGSDRQIITSEDKDGNIVPITGNVIQFAPQDKNESDS